VLDIGCGRGAVLISAAHRLPRGQATGADIWRLRDQTGNSRRTSRYTTSTGGRGPAFPAITSRLSQRDSRLPGPATSGPRARIGKDGGAVSDDVVVIDRSRTVLMERCRLIVR
jgi:hypothetical protein